MPKHSKNATAAPFISATERKKQSWGSRTQRLGKDSLLPFAHCYLCTQWAADAVVSPSGHMYCKECIFKNLLTQRGAIKKQKAAYKAQQRAEAAASEAQAVQASAASLQAFMDQETNPAAGLTGKGPVAASVTGHGSTVQAAAFASVQEGAAASGRTEQERAEAEARQNTAAVAQAAASADLRHASVKHAEIAATSFWAPVFTPQAEATKVKRPKLRPSSPITGEPLLAKQLVPVKFHVEDKDEAASGGKGRYCCAVTRKSITYQPAVLLRGSGAVVLASAFEAAVRESGADPMTGAPLHPGDVIPLASEGSGFAGRAGSKLMATQYRPGKA